MVDRSDFAVATIQMKNALKEAPILLAPHLLLGCAYLGHGFGLEAERRGADPFVTEPLLARAYFLHFKLQPSLKEFNGDGLSEFHACVPACDTRAGANQPWR